MIKKITYLLLLSFILLLSIVLVVWFPYHEEASPIPVKRYEIASMQIDTMRIEDELNRLYKEFPLFLEGADLSDADNQQQYLDFAKDPRAKGILNDILKKYPHLKSFEMLMGQGFCRYNKDFERGEKTPAIYTYLSYLDYDNRVLFLDSVLIVAIDMYLGANYEHYDAIALPMYIRQRLDEPFMAVDAMKAVAHYELTKTPQPQKTLLDYMILNGKVLYFLEKVLPETKAHTRFGYTPEQMKWCEQSEKKMWTYLMASQLLFEQDNFEFRSFVEESPTVQVFPGSPGRVGHFLGYRIVKKYMENSKQSLPELFAEQDIQKILKVSNYRP